MKKFATYILLLSLILSAGYFDMEAYASSDLVSRLSCIRFVVNNSSVDKAAIDVTLLEKYKDTYELSETDKETVSLAIKYNIIQGYGDGTLRLTQNVTRAEFACMIYRIRDYYNPPTDKITYNGDYSDLSDWNEKEIGYCIEHGYLMGYGDLFGSDDYITSAQLDIIGERLRYGLTTRQKYNLYDICGISPIPMNDILNSAYNDEICEYTLQLTVKGGGEYERYIDEPMYEKTIIADEMIVMMDAIGNQDYEKLKNEDYKQYQLRLCLTSISTPDSIVFRNDRTTRIEDIIYETANNGIKRESIHVFAPENCYKTVFPTVFTTKQSCGYEYFRYTEGSNLPEGIELYTWYRRKASVIYMENIGRNETLIISYEAPVVCNF